MANKFLNILSNKVKINNNKLEIETANIGLDDNKSYKLIIPNNVLKDKAETSLTFTVASRMTTLPSGRKIYRHRNDEGSVLRFDMFGTEINLFIPDCKYRNVLKWGTYGTDNPGLTNLVDLGSMNYIHGSPDPIELTDTIPVVTDAELQTNYHNLVTMDKTAEYNCNSWLNYVNSTDNANITGVPQIEYVRSLSFQDIDHCDIPNIYQLMVIYLEQDAIDNLDKYKDDSRYNDCLLSSLNPVQRWSFKNKASSCALASTEYGEYHVWGMCYRGGYEGGVMENEDAGCIPVKEFYDSY